MNNIDERIFKSYDIRGIYPDQLDEKVAYLIGRAFARRAKSKEAIVGSDMRLSGPALKTELVRGITDEGVNVIDIGLVPIDAVYFAVGILKYPAGIMITASHNPAEYNGFKMPLTNSGWISGEELKEDVKNLDDKISETKGDVKELDIMEKYIKHVLSFCQPEKIKKFKVVVDAGNGMAGKVIPLLAKHLPIEVVPLNFKLDGSFPAHPSNPLLPESQKQITEAVVREKADFGVIFDGDTDRLFFIDEQGKFVAADLTLLILAQEFLKREPGAGIVYNAICSKVVPEKISEWGGKPIKSKVGFIYVREEMKKYQGIMGGELSAHYSFRDNDYADSGFIAFVILLQLLSEEDKVLSEVVKPFSKYFKSPESNLELENRDKIEPILAELEKEYQDGKIDKLDGLTVKYEDWWFNVRPSNTEPLLRITVEADAEELMKKKLEELVDFANKNK